MALPLAGICQLAPSAPKWLADMGGPNGSSTSTMMKVDAQKIFMLLALIPELLILTLLPG